VAEFFYRSKVLHSRYTKEKLIQAGNMTIWDTKGKLIQSGNMSINERSEPQSILKEQTRHPEKNDVFIHENISHAKINFAV